MNIIEIVVRGTNELGPMFEQIKAQARSEGRAAGKQIGKDVSAGVDEALPDAGDAGERLGIELARRNRERLKQDLPDAVEKPLEDSGRKGGQKAGQAAAQGISPLIAGAFAAAATTGPGVLLAATAVAVVGAGALLTKGNADLAASYQRLGSAASDMVTTATAPLVPQLSAAVGILQRGIGQVGPELKSVFDAVAPDVTHIASGLVALVGNTLPGMASALRAIAPFASDIAVDFGKIGSGLGGFFQGLGTGAAGGMAGFNAVADILKEVLTDAGQLVGALANGLGPALHDVANVALPVAHALTAVIDAFPPGVIRAAADATLALFLAFKAASLAGLLKDGASFLTFLRGAALAEDAAATGAKAWGAAMDAIPLVAVAAAIGGLALAADKLGGTGDHTSVSVDKFTSSLIDAANGSQGAQDGVVKLATALALMNGTMGMSLQGLKDIDTSLTNLYQSDPAAAAKEFDAITASLKAQGQSADQVAKEFPQYTKAVADAQLQAKEAAAANTALGGSVDVLTQKLTAANLSTQDNARQSAAATLAALGYADGESALATQLNITLQAFTEASGEASAYKTALDALYGKYQSYSDAQATFTEDLDKASKGLKASKEGFDATTTAGAANYKLMSSLATANENRAEALLKETGNQQQANKELQNGALAIDNMAKKAGFTKTQIDALNIALYGTKNIGDISVPISADTSAAYNEVSKVINWIGAQTAYIQVQTVGGAPGGKQLLATGGVVGAYGRAASGGGRGGMTLVGEHGPELVTLPFGSTVHSNPDSRRMLGDGGGSQVVTLEVAPAGASAFEQFMVMALRQWVRARAGNAPNSVQKAFGQSF